MEKGESRRYATTRIVNGEKQRQCRGPAHEEPVWLPLTEKYFYPRRTETGFKSPCRLCHLYKYSGVGPGEHGFVKASAVQPFFIEGVNKVGLWEFSRRIGMHYENVRKIVTGKRQFVRKLNAKKAMLEIVSIRRKGEIRHRKSILRGAAIRGEKERVVKARVDLYKPHGDIDSEQKRARQSALEV